MSVFQKGGAAKGTDGISQGIGPSPKVAEYSSFGADIDLLSGGPGGASGAQQAPRAVMCTDAGAGTKKLVLVCADGSSVNIDCTNLVGVILPIAARTITNTTTTIARVLVFW